MKDGGPVRVRDVVPAHAIWRLSRHCFHVLPSPGLSIHFLSHYMYASLGGSHVGGGNKYRFSNCINYIGRVGRDKGMEHARMVSDKMISLRGVGDVR